ncbi:formylglycine-generating enzyme family protein [Streptacidiphilus sp. P02-A3a]|nr:formylglycine-generating enzyme family protein [Streptacidiphilus sp. P02-A3a]QMU73937.1 formylglycine-generating enzyme family protein [Streptacidiphilus sp. P02-A3a]
MRHPVDGKLMARIAEGIHLCGAANSREWIEEYWIDVYPTTNRDYERFTTATGHPAPSHWPEGRVPASLADHPVVWVSWLDASAYAAWAGKVLPSSRQWEKAARGTTGERYPWGTSPTAAKCNVRESGIAGTTAVSRYHSGVSPYGVYDLCGNTWEWLSTPGSASGRYQLKGSAFTSPFYRCEPTSVNDASMDMSDEDTGFRCATPLR